LLLQHGLMIRNWKI